jgi:hypothetical protein
VSGQVRAREDPVAGATSPTAADKRRAEVIALAARLFDRHGYANVSMEQIAIAAGIAKPDVLGEAAQPPPTVFRQPSGGRQAGPCHAVCATAAGVRGLGSCDDA